MGLSQLEQGAAPDGVESFPFATVSHASAALRSQLLTKHVWTLLSPMFLFPPGIVKWV